MGYTLLSDSAANQLRQDHAKLREDVGQLRAIVEANRHTQPATECYLAQTPASGIAGISGDTPTSASCTIYRLNPGTSSLEAIASSQTVYNPHKDNIPGSVYQPVLRNAADGKWYATHSGSLIPFTLTATLEVGGTAAATNDIDSSAITVADVGKSPGFHVGESGHIGYAWLNPATGFHSIISMDKQSRFIDFTLTENWANTTAGHASATITDNWDGATPASLSIDVQDVKDLFTEALNGAKGKAVFYDQDTERDYEVVACQQRALYLTALLSADLATTDATASVDTVSPVSPPPLNQDPGALGSVQNKYKLSGSNNDPVLLMWDTDEASYVVIAVPSFFIFKTVATDSGNAVATVPTDTVTFTGTGGVTTSASGKTVTIDGSGAGGSNALLDGSSHTDTVAQGVTRGSLIYGNATPKWDELVIGTATYFLQSDGTDAAWGTINALTADATPDASADYLMSWDADASAHKKILLSNLPAHGANGLGNLEWRSSSSLSYTAFSVASTGPKGVTTGISLAEGEHVQAALIELETQFTGGMVANTLTEHGDASASASTDNVDCTTYTAAKKYFANSLYSSPLQSDGLTGGRTLYIWMSSVGDNLDQLTAGSLKAHYLIGTCP